MAFRVAMFDIECTELVANRGHILCASLKTSDEDTPKTWRIDDYKLFKKEPWNDRELCTDLAEALEGCDLLVGWYSSRYDWPFLNSRLVKNGLLPLDRRLHHDLWRTARANLCLTSNRLESVSDFLGTKIKKNHLDWVTWEKAAFGIKEAMDYLAEHCELDVLVLEEAFDRLKGFIRQVRS